jgi:methionine-rich copper-binding protein CopC
MKQKLAAVLVLALVAVGGTYAPSTSGLMHFALAKSMPAADSSVPAPSAVQLWFTEAPQTNSVSIRLIEGSGELVETSLPKMDEEDDKAASVSVEGALGSGEYTVAWRGIGADGHVVRGEYAFSVSAR